MKTAITSSRAVLLGAAILLGACGGSNEEAEPICDELNVQTCDCEFGTGFSYCLPDQTGFGDCVCPIKEAVVGADVVQIDRVAGGAAVELDGDRGLLGSRSAGSPLADLEVGDFVQSWQLGLMGRVTAVSVEGDQVRVETEPCALTDVFETLDIDYNRPVALAAMLPPAVREEIRKERALRSLRQRALVQRSALGQEVEGETEPIAGVTLSFEGKFDIGIDFEEDSYIDFLPNLFMKLKIRDFKLQHAAIDASVSLDLLLKLRAEIEASVSGTAELDILQLIAYLTTGVDDYVARVSLGAGLELEMWALVGITAELDGHVAAVPYFQTSGEAYGGVYYSRDWTDPVWDDAPERIQDGRENWNTAEWYTAGDSNFTAEAGLSEFSWGAHGGIEAYFTAKYALTLLRCGGPTFDVQPYVGFDAWIGDKNKLEAALGVRGNAGGKIELFGEETLWEDSWELFDYKYILWEYSWMLCGDGIRSTDCYDLECDHCPNAGCGGEPEECDAGLFAYIDGQGSDALGDARPCIPPGEEGACTCGVGWAPTDGTEWFWSNLDEDDVQWGDRRNWCVRTCGNSVVEPDEGEVCDHSGSPGCDSNCNDDCTAPAGVCGNGVVECYEECDDGNTESCDGCSELCVEEPGSGGCGDGYRCGDEECDDGNDDECDGCYSDCTRRVYSCGDGFRCDDEGCDDGNTIGCDGCSSNCQPETGCGDGFRCGAEECDDGNLDNGDGCSDVCKTEGCGDGVVQEWLNEECDDGNRIDCDGCHFNCTLDTGCGDGIVCVQQGEECEDGNLVDCDSCYNDCTLNTDTCGDGHKCGDEVCDDGNLQPGDGCATNCMSDETCGNGVVDAAVGEACDDGNRIDCDTCSADCRHEITGCGDGVQCGDEVCDDGNTQAGDGCRPDCAGTEECGDHLLDVGESCENTTTNGIDLGCTDDQPDCIDDCGRCVARCGDGVKADTETCDLNPGGTDFGCTAENPECIDNCTVCGVDCSDNICGDGKLCDPEECDDGNVANQDGCAGDCRVERCGDGVIQAWLGEKCDDGNTTGGDGCSSDCMSDESCGNGVIDDAAGENCDDDSVDGIDTGCSVGSPDCMLNCRVCATRCGDGVMGPGENCERTSPDGIDMNCTESHPVCKYDCTQCLEFECGDGVVNPPEVCDTDPVPCVDPNGYAGERICHECFATGECVATESCGDGTVNGNEECDDGDRDSCTRACSADCMHANLPAASNCGDGILECDEVCDDWNQEDGDGCSADCLSDETCGNGITDSAVGEQCDDENFVDRDGCSADCLSDETCGNGVVDALVGEVCDDGNTDDCVGTCAADCLSIVEVPVCGDGFVDPTCEVCEDSDPTNVAIDDGCTSEGPNCNMCSACTADVCGDGIVGPSETCDEGGSCSNNDAIPCTALDTSACGDPEATCEPFTVFYDVYGEGPRCNRDCQYSNCGDGIVQPAEMCDDSDPDNLTIDDGCTEATPNCSSTCMGCGS